MPELIPLLMSSNVASSFIYHRIVDQTIALEVMNLDLSSGNISWFLTYLSLFDKNNGNREQYYVEPIHSTKLCF